MLTGVHSPVKIQSVFIVKKPLGLNSRSECQRPPVTVAPSPMPSWETIGRPSSWGSAQSPPLPCGHPALESHAVGHLVCELYVNYVIKPALFPESDSFILLLMGLWVISCSGLLCKSAGWMFLGLFASHIYMFFAGH